MANLSIAQFQADYEYELSRLDKAIEKVSHVIEKYSDHPHAYEYYTTMQECLIALSFAMQEAKNMQRLYTNLKNRVVILENTIAKGIVQ